MKKRASRRPLTSSTARFVDGLKTQSNLERALAIASGSFLLPLVDDAMKAAQAAITGEWTEERSKAAPAKRKRPAAAKKKRARQPKA